MLLPLRDSALTFDTYFLNTIVEINIDEDNESNIDLNTQCRAASAYKQNAGRQVPGVGSNLQ
jgi:hypothetical protein